MKFQIFVVVSFVCVLSVFAEKTPVAAVATKGVGKLCEPGKEFTKDGHTCTCNAEGTDCENLDCPDGGNVPEVTPQETGDKCTPGELYKEKCNECKCPESGLKSQASCTVIACSDD